MFPQNGNQSGLTIEQVQTEVAKQRAQLIGSSKPVCSDKIDLFPIEGSTSGIAVARIVFDEGVSGEKTLLAIVGRTKEGRIKLAKVTLESTHRQKGLYFNNSVQYDERTRKFQIACSKFEHPYREQWKEVRTETVEFTI